METLKNQKTFNKVTELEREKIISDYLQNEEYQKHALCPYWWRGLCLFEKEICKFAHGVDDLKFSPEAIQKNWNLGRAPLRLKCLKLERNYKTLFEYQDELISRGEMDEKYSQEEVNEKREVRIMIRRLFHSIEAGKIIPFIFERFKNTYITKTFFTNVLKGLAIPISIMNLNSNKYYYEIKASLPPALSIKKDYYVKMEPVEEFKAKVQGILDNVIIELAKQGIPIKIENITRDYYKVRNPLDPPFHIFLQKYETNAEEYFTELDENGYYQKMLGLPEDKKIFSLKSSLSEKDIQSLILFLEEKNKPIMSFKNIHRLLQEFKKKTEISFLQQPVKLIAREIFKIMNKEIFLISNLNDWFILNSKINSTNESLKSAFSNCKCPCKMIPDLKKTSNVISQEISSKYDNERVILIDNEEKLSYAKATLPKYSIMAVDLEGKLRFINIHMYLIQFGIIKENGQRQIFVFDIIAFEKMEKSLLEDMKKFVSSILSSEDHIKILHDSRHDSIAIHAYFNCCLANIRDSSPIYILLEQLEIIEEDNIENISKFYSRVSSISSPGINEILNKYEADNGVNLFKQDIKQKSKVLGSEWFTKRPINPDFLEYSVKDVEDLVECYKKMEIKIYEKIEKYNPKIQKNHIKELLLRISKSYYKFGCKEYKKNTENTDNDDEEN